MISCFVELFYKALDSQEKSSGGSYIKERGRGVLVENLEKNPKEKDPVLWAWLKAGVNMNRCEIWSDIKKEIVRIKGAVSRQSSSFCLVFPITRP